MGLGVSLGIVARKKTIIMLAIGLTVVSAVSTAIAQAGGIVDSASRLAAKLLPAKEKLILVDECKDPCIRQCIVTVEAVDGSRAKTILTVIPLDTSIGGAAFDGVGVGYLLSSSLGLVRGDNITVYGPGGILESRVASVYRTGSQLDTGVVVRGDPAGVPWCNQSYYTVAEESVRSHIAAFSEQVKGLTTHWVFASTLLLAFSALIASVKAYNDLSVEAEVLVTEGGNPWSLPTALGLVFASGVLAGYGWGLFLADAVNSVVGSLTGVYVPRPPPTPESLATQALAPSLLSGLSALVAGFLYGGRIAGANG